MIISFPPLVCGDERKDFNYSCYDLKQPSKVNLSVYFLPADGWEKVIEIRRFSNGTAIFLDMTLY
ncbi:MAG: hypothetical protein LBR79_02525 [Oscillospiraceae bacterium]|nr:hypothetical protein [Oscillospiraceae bacterium]